MSLAHPSPQQALWLLYQVCTLPAVSALNFYCLSCLLPATQQLKLLGPLLATCHIGAKTGRSPRDKRVVREAESENDIWWNQDKNGSPNFEMDERWVLIQHSYMTACVHL